MTLEKKYSNYVINICDRILAKIFFFFKLNLKFHFVVHFKIITFSKSTCYITFFKLKSCSNKICGSSFYRIDVTILSTFLRPILTVASV